MKKTIYILGIFFIILLFAILYLSGKNLDKKEQLNIESTTTPEEMIDESDLESLVVKHQYQKSKHIFIGDIEFPTPCYELEANIIDTATPNLKRIDIKTKKIDGVCAEVITNKTFRVEYEGPSELQFEAYVDNSKRRLNIFDLAPDVDIDEFELFIKG